MQALHKTDRFETENTTHADLSFQSAGSKRGKAFLHGLVLPYSIPLMIGKIHQLDKSSLEIPSCHFQVCSVNSRDCLQPYNEYENKKSTLVLGFWIMFSQLSTLCCHGGYSSISAPAHHTDIPQQGTLTGPRHTSGIWRLAECRKPRACSWFMLGFQSPSKHCTARLNLILFSCLLCGWNGLPIQSC